MNSGESKNLQLALSDDVPTIIYAIIKFPPNFNLDGLGLVLLDLLNNN